eukprot:13649763-Alexandrium_andersonii.AAC.1
MAVAFAAAFEVRGGAFAARSARRGSALRRSRTRGRSRNGASCSTCSRGSVSYTHLTLPTICSV